MISYLLDVFGLSDDPPPDPWWWWFQPPKPKPEGVVSRLFSFLGTVDLGLGLGLGVVAVAFLLTVCLLLWRRKRSVAPLKADRMKRLQSLCHKCHSHEKLNNPKKFRRHWKCKINESSETEQKVERDSLLPLHKREQCFYCMTKVIVVFLKHLGTTDWSRERLKMSAKTSASWSAQDLRTRPGTPSEPVVFHEFTLKKAFLTSAVETVERGAPGDDGAGSGCHQ